MEAMRLRSGQRNCVLGMLALLLLWLFSLWVLELAMSEQTTTAAITTNATMTTTAVMTTTTSALVQ